MQKLNLEKIKNYLLVTVCVLALLYFGRTLFIPMSFSMLISFLLYPICAWLEKYGIQRRYAVVICIFLLMIFILMITALLFQQISSFSHD